MLPIDEHAKSGAWVWAWSGYTGGMFKVRWDENSPFGNAKWQHNGHFGMYELNSTFTHYLPASWVENAGKMREALHKVAMTSTDPNLEAEAISIMCATEWPEVKG